MRAEMLPTNRSFDHVIRTSFIDSHAKLIDIY